MYLGPIVHVRRPEYCFESHHLYLTHAVCSSFRIRFQGGGNPKSSPRSEIAITLVTARPDDGCFDTKINSILGGLLLLLWSKSCSETCRRPCQQKYSFPGQSFDQNTVLRFSFSPNFL